MQISSDLTDVTHAGCFTHRGAGRLAARRFVFVPVLCLDAVGCAQMLHGHQAHHVFLHGFHRNLYF